MRLRRLYNKTPHRWDTRTYKTRRARRIWADAQDFRTGEY